MRRTTIIILALTATAHADHARLLDAIHQVENPHNTRAPGDHGLALGPYQIHPDFWADCRMATPYKTGVWNDALCRHAIRNYWARYGAHDDRTKALLFHFGPNWRHYDQVYWSKVQQKMKGATQNDHSRNAPKIDRGRRSRDHQTSGVRSSTPNPHRSAGGTRRAPEVHPPQVRHQGIDTPPAAGIS